MADERYERAGASGEAAMMNMRAVDLAMAS